MAPAHCPHKDNSKIEIFFFLLRKQSMVPLDKVLEWRNVKKPFRQI